MQSIGSCSNKGNRTNGGAGALNPEPGLFLYCSSAPLLTVDPSGLIEARHTNIFFRLPEWRGIYLGVGGGTNITFNFENSEFINEIGCCTCNKIGIHQSANATLLYGHYVSRRVEPIDGGFPYKYGKISTDGTHTSSLREFFNPCKHPGGHTTMIAVDDPWAPMWDPFDYLFAPFGARDRLMMFRFQARTCLVCAETRYYSDMGAPSTEPDDITVNLPGKSLSCVEWGFTITWDGSKYVGH